MVKSPFNVLTVETEKEKNFRLLEDAIIKVSSVMENINRLEAGGSEEKRKHVRMALTLEQVVSNLLKLQKRLCGKTSSHAKTKRAIAKRLKELEKEIL